MNGLSELKQEYREKLEYHSDIVRRYLDQYGNDGCDYLRHHISMKEYYRGAYNAIIAAERL